MPRAIIRDMYPSPCSQLGTFHQQMLDRAGVTPITSAIDPAWRQVGTVCCDMNARMNHETLDVLQSTPGTYALCEGLLRNSTGYLWWDGAGWIWEGWHWNRWPVERHSFTLERVAEHIGATI